VGSAATAVPPNGPDRRWLASERPGTARPCEEGEVPLDVVRGPVRAEIEVTRSRFIADLAPVPDADAAGEVVGAARREFHAARHHCSAWVLGPEGELVRANDDGEPAGTAGAPMLAVLRGAGLTDVVAVVTRYFGGTLLGAGGLVRAYGDAVAAAVAEVRRVPRRVVTEVEVRAGHADAGRVEHLLRHRLDALDGAVEPGEYDAAGARFTLVVPPSAVEELRAALASSGLVHGFEVRGDHVRAR
jgi:uncharacterized YigZ family protein